MLRWGGGRLIPNALLSACLRHHDLVRSLVFHVFLRLLIQRL